jgi:hypothetical protein
MRIRFENTIDDLVAFNKFHHEHSPATKRIVVGQMFIVAAAFLIPGVVVAAVTENWWFLVWMAATGLVATLTVPPWYRRYLERYLRRMYGEGGNKGMVGWRELELMGNELVERTPVGESRTHLEAVERVVSEGDYTFIYTSAVMAFVIPHASVSEGDPMEFAVTIKQNISPTPLEVRSGM